MPPGVADMIYSIWGHQCRWLQLHGHVLPQPTQVTTSLPQGDAWAMMVMASLLTVPWTQMKQDFPDAKFALYVDDRTWCTPSAQQCFKIAEAWMHWSQTLG